MGTTVTEDEAAQVQKANASGRTPVVFVHGLFLLPTSWDRWAELFEHAGYASVTPGYPDDPATVEEAKEHPEALAGKSIGEVADHVEEVIKGLTKKPVIIGHSFGGLFTQLLADRGLGTAAVTLGTGAPKGVLRLPLSTLRAAWPALGNPRNLKKETPLTPKQFHWCFTNALSREDSDAVYERYYIPGSARPFFQAGSANFNPNAVTKVDYRNASRPPMLLVTGTEDRICPPSVNKANFKKQRQAPSATEHKEYPGRCHFPGQDGWEEVADFVLAWAAEHSNRTAQAG
jgi:non-heme chloroperoxidase